MPPQLTTVETLDAYFEVPVETGNGVKVNFVWLHNGEPVHFGKILSHSYLKFGSDLKIWAMNVSPLQVLVSMENWRWEQPV